MLRGINVKFMYKALIDGESNLLRTTYSKQHFASQIKVAPKLSGNVSTLIFFLLSTIQNCSTYIHIFFYTFTSNSPLPFIAFVLLVEFY